MRSAFLAFFLLFVGLFGSQAAAHESVSSEARVLLERLSAPFYSQQQPSVAPGGAIDTEGSAAELQLISGGRDSSQQGRLVQIDGVGSTGEENALFQNLDGETEEVEVPSILFEGTGGRARLPKIRQSEPFRYTNYRSKENTFGVIPEKGDRFGITSLESTAYSTSGYGNGFNLGYAFHFLSGPQQIDLPARLYQFSMGYQSRGRMSEYLSYDGAVAITVNSDFEGSAREGVFLPGHFAGMLHVTPEMDWVLGVDYLHRDDIKLLPIVGFSYHSDWMPNVRWDLVFPRPKVQFALPGGHMFHVAGRLGGGTWDFELPSGVEDVVTYRDYRLLLGFSRGRGKEGIQSIEVGYLFGRKLELRDANSFLDLSDAVAIQFVTIK
ncbi:MAG: hypothetical protein MUC43_16750 [Pirellula sp.]|jgi:hypothetical protein|nr:hypothetical protein [Pirellula sp.]